MYIWICPYCGYKVESLLREDAKKKAKNHLQAKHVNDILASDVKVKCPSCKREFSLREATINGNCPYCGYNILNWHIGYSVSMSIKEINS